LRLTASSYLIGASTGSAAEGQVGNCRQPQDGLAGDAVLIAPVSKRIPCKQRIFQGIGRNLPPQRPLPRTKSPIYSTILAIPYQR
jgi:hypothetical protein